MQFLVLHADVLLVEKVDLSWVTAMNRAKWRHHSVRGQTQVNSNKEPAKGPGHRTVRCRGLGEVRPSIKLLFYWLPNRPWNECAELRAEEERRYIRTFCTDTAPEQTHLAWYRVPVALSLSLSRENVSA